MDAHKYVVYLSWLSSPQSKNDWEADCRVKQAWRWSRHFRWHSRKCIRNERQMKKFIAQRSIQGVLCIYPQAVLVSDHYR